MAFYILSYSDLYLIDSDVCHIIIDLRLTLSIGLVTNTMSSIYKGSMTLLSFISSQIGTTVSCDDSLA